MNKQQLMSSLFACTLYTQIYSANAAIFNWTDTNTNVTRGPSSYSLTVDGITAIARAYVAEWNGLNYDIYDAFPTGTGFTTANADGFLRGNEGLLLEEGSFPGISLSGQEGCSGGGCGFDNGSYRIPDQDVLKFNFALITFDQSVDLQTSMNLRQSIFDHDFWLASSSNAPDLGLAFISAFADFNTTVHNPEPTFQGATGLSGIHQDFTYLVIDAPLHSLAGNFDGFNNPDVLSDTFSIMSLTVEHTTVPVPAAVWLFGTGILGMLGISRKKGLRWCY
jgi:hypothetical protein